MLPCKVQESVATQLLSVYIRVLCKDYLAEKLVPLITALCEESASLEVLLCDSLCLFALHKGSLLTLLQINPALCGQEQAEKNTQSLLSTAQLFLFTVCLPTILLRTTM